MARFRFAAVGDNCIDRFQPPVSQTLVGGNAVNVAVQWARLGHDAFYFGAVGEDADGVRTLGLLAESGVDIDHVPTLPGVTAYTDISVLPSGDRVMTHEDFGVCKGYRPSLAEVEVLKTMDHVHLGWIDDGGDLRRRLVAAGISVSQDVSVNADPADLGVEGLIIAFGSAGENALLAEHMRDDLLSRGAGLAVVTRGALGSIAGDGVKMAETAIRPVDVVDTTGAGDSFIAGFSAAFADGRPLLFCLEAGRDCAAFTCTHVGGFPQEPQPL